MSIPTHRATFVFAGMVVQPPALMVASVATKTPGLQYGMRDKGVVFSSTVRLPCSVQVARALR